MYFAPTIPASCLHITIIIWWPADKAMAIPVKKLVVIFGFGHRPQAE